MVPLDELGRRQRPRRWRVPLLLVPAMGFVALLWFGLQRADPISRLSRGRRLSNFHGSKGGLWRPRSLKDDRSLSTSGRRGASRVAKKHRSSSGRGVTTRTMGSSLLESISRTRSRRQRVRRRVRQHLPDRPRRELERFWADGASGDVLHRSRVEVYRERERLRGGRPSGDRGSRRDQRGTTCHQHRDPSPALRRR